MSNAVFDCEFLSLVKHYPEETNDPGWHLIADAAEAFSKGDGKPLSLIYRRELATESIVIRWALGYLYPSTYRFRIVQSGTTWDNYRTFKDFARIEMRKYTVLPEIRAPDKGFLAVALGGRHYDLYWVYDDEFDIDELLPVISWHVPLLGPVFNEIHDCRGKHSTAHVPTLWFRVKRQTPAVIIGSYKADDIIIDPQRVMTSYSAVPSKKSPKAPPEVLVANCWGTATPAMDNHLAPEIQEEALDLLANARMVSQASLVSGGTGSIECTVPHGTVIGFMGGADVPYVNSVPITWC